jgi:ABC-2 type transport system permease protein
MFDFHRVFLIAVREVTSRFSQRSFRITLVAQMLIFLTAACLPTIISAFEGGDDGPNREAIAVLDETGGTWANDLQATLGAFNSSVTTYDVSAFDGDRDALATAIDDDDLDGGLIITPGSDGQAAFTWTSDDGEADILSQQVYGAIASILTEQRLQALGVAPDEFAQATAAPAFSISGTGSTDDTSDAEEGAKYGLAYVLALVSYMAVMLYGNWVAQGVVEEKASRIMEIMINAATPRDLLFGKVLGIGMAAMAQLLPSLLVGGIAFTQQKRIADLLNVSGGTALDIDFGAISIGALLWFVAFFVVGFILYAALYAGVASLVSRQEEVNQAIAPFTTLLVGGFFGAIVTLGAPDSTIARVLGFIPFTSPTSMVPRIILGDPAPWEPVVSLAILVVSATLALIVAARIYRVGVLMYGQKPKLTTVLRSSCPVVSR